MAQPVILAIDEGTTNSKAVLISQNGSILASGSSPVPTQHPQSGWVQQDANEIWAATQNAINSCVQKITDVEIVALGISNQRESILIWDRYTEEPLGPVITWQCRRTSGACEVLRNAGHEPEVLARTGLPLDPMFPPTKMAWLLEECAAGRQDVCIGTVDSWLIWKLSGGKIHATDRSNAARTQLFNLSNGCWDVSLCSLFRIPLSMLPEVRDSAFVFGSTKGNAVVPDGIPIASAIGDSHAALFGHGAFGKSDGKITFGTGSSIMTTIPEFITPPKGITTTIAWSINGRSTYALEGNILVSASILPWTADILGAENVEQLLTLARSANDSHGVSVIPAHVGLGSPHWNSDARGLICGLSFNSGRANIARAACESMAFQVNDIYEIMADKAKTIGRLFVDGGPSQNEFLMQMVADYLGRPIIPCKNSEASAIGAAFLAGLATGFWSDLETISKLPTHGIKIGPQMPDQTRKNSISLWRKAIARTTLVV